jgi:hypothetical protein
MIVRVLEVGQYEIPQAVVPELESLEELLASALEADDETEFASQLAAMAALVHDQGTPVPPDAFVPSDLVVLAPDTTVQEARRILADSEE